MIAGTWQQIGIIRFPLAFCLLAVLGLGIYSLRRLSAAEGVPPVETGTWIDSVLFWGGFAFITGVLGSLIGVVVAAQAIEDGGGGVSQALIWGGLKVSMLSSVVGTLILAVSALIWFALHFRRRMMVAMATG